MFGLFKRKKKTDPVLEKLLRENEILEKILDEYKKESAELEESIAEAEKALKALGYTDDDFKRIEQKSKMKVIKEDEA